MTHSSIILLISSVLALIGIILLMSRGKMKKGLVIYEDAQDSNEKQEQGEAKDLIIMDPKNYPELLKVNMGIIGMKMSGSFARKNAPPTFYASYNCFHVLFCPVFPLGCFLIQKGGFGQDLSSLGELKTEKDELLFVLSKGWGVLLIIVAILILFFGLPT